MILNQFKEIIVQKKKIQILENTIRSQGNKIQISQEGEPNIQNNRTQGQEKRIQILENTIRQLEREIKIQENTDSQEKKILENTIARQEKAINIQANRTKSQEKKIQSLLDTIKKLEQQSKGKKRKA